MLNTEIAIDLFNKVVAENLSAVAIIEESGRSISYSELDRLSMKLTTLIQSITLSDTSTFVSVMTGRNMSFVVAILAVLKAKATYIPVDPSFPIERQKYILSHSKSSLLIVDEESHKSVCSLIDSPPQTLVVNERGELILNSLKSPESLVMHRKDDCLTSGRRNGLAYVLYTSGSTGKPKGVMVKNSSVINTVNWFCERLKISKSSRVLALATFCFDISVLEIFMPLTRGGVLIIASNASQKNPFRLIDVMNANNINVFQATPTTYEMMLATGWNGNQSIDFLVGGEAFRPSILAVASNCRSFHNAYGPTETTIYSCAFKIDSKWSKPTMPIGEPISQVIQTNSQIMNAFMLT